MSGVNVMNDLYQPNSNFAIFQNFYSVMLASLEIKPVPPVWLAKKINDYTTHSSLKHVQPNTNKKGTL